MSASGIGITPKEPSENSLYLIESLEQIDSVVSVYYEYEWTPHLEEFFPEDGMLLLYLSQPMLK